jgi:MFS family permease
LILKALDPKASQLHDLLATLAIFALAALPGYLGAVAGMDVIGRKRIQWIGFAMMALTYIALASIPGGQANLWPFLLLFGINYFFVEFGPNTTTFVFPSEIFPSRVRTTSHGIAATVGKIGATIGAFTFPLLLARFAVPGPMIAAAGCAIVGAILTLTMLPEPKGMSLEDASRDDLLNTSEPAAA